MTLENMIILVRNQRCQQSIGRINLSWEMVHSRQMLASLELEI